MCRIKLVKRENTGLFYYWFFYQKRLYILFKLYTKYYYKTLGAWQYLSLFVISQFDSIEMRVWDLIWEYCLKIPLWGNQMFKIIDTFGSVKSNNACLFSQIFLWVMVINENIWQYLEIRMSKHFPALAKTFQLEFGKIINYAWEKAVLDKCFRKIGNLLTFWKIMIDQAFSWSGLI